MCVFFFFGRNSGSNIIERYCQNTICYSLQRAPKYRDYIPPGRETVSEDCHAFIMRWKNLLQRTAAVKPYAEKKLLIPVSVKLRTVHAMYKFSPILHVNSITFSRWNRFIFPLVPHSFALFMFSFTPPQRRETRIRIKPAVTDEGDSEHTEVSQT
jgi:hypothetical protein